MLFKNKPKPKPEPLPPLEIVPTFHGKWALLVRDYLPFGGQYMREAATYSTYEEAVADAKHLGLEL
jgi:hypothetical protein